MKILIKNLNHQLHTLKSYPIIPKHHYNTEMHSHVYYKALGLLTFCKNVYKLLIISTIRIKASRPCLAVNPALASSVLVPLKMGFTKVSVCIEMY